MKVTNCFTWAKASLLSIGLILQSQITQSAILSHLTLLSRDLVIDSNSVMVKSSMFPVSDNKFFKGKVIYSKKSNINSWFSILPTIKSIGDFAAKEKAVKMVSLGGGLSAGVRNGGLYRFGQITAFPNLVARQLGVKDFRTPLFSQSEANGTGFLQLVDDGTPYPTWQQINNDIATLQEGDIPEYDKYSESMVQNLAVPQGDLILANSRLCKVGCGIYSNGKTWTVGQVFSRRIIPASLDETKVSLVDYMHKQSFNFYLLEDGFDELIEVVKKNTNLHSYGFTKVNLGEVSILNVMIRHLKQKAEIDKGVIFTLPMVTDLAFMNWYSIHELKNKTKSITIEYKRNGKLFTLSSSSNFLLMPTAKVDSIYRNTKKGDNLKIKLTDADVMDAQELHMTTDMIKIYNEMVRKWAKLNNLGLVDLEILYKSINDGSYKNESDLKIEGGLKGNFFSADGIYPTALGHAIIANEVINAVNKTYNSEFPLISLETYEKFVKQE